MHEHADAIEADLLRFYHLDLAADLGTDRLTWRRLAVLLKHLPQDAATLRALDPAATWGVTDHLLAAVLNTLRVANWQRAAKKNAPQPEMVTPPGVKVSRRSTLTTQEKLARLLELERRARGGATWPSS